MPVGVTDGDVPGRGVVALVHGNDPLGWEPVDGGDHWCVDEFAVGEREEVESVVDDVEVGCAFERRGDVEALGDFWLDARIVRPTPGRSGMQGGELFPRAVEPRRGPPGNGCERRASEL